ncbi:glutamyl-tRNA synthetase [Jatrophihabitans endophyticus]|uniref:Glutamate--tRNA ligase n=1 Tax=Jatrophihabitans endophyticus TaxID=1206085 RepID=A0A1M5D8N0_9ACTN|nr:glutamate--tRNA ligase [Jatrophihabitans endophyticus]SHF63247.1 glutamyl-tRNA synthetase [Jatrophihabitans endophyticus]
MSETSARPPRVRVAPSPTGDPHVGTAYMSLFNLGFARRYGGQFVLRIEDTDRARFRADSEQQIYDTLHWLGLDWDEGPDRGGPYAPYRQSERLDTYQPFVDQLLADGHAYHCWCSPERLTEMREQQRARKLPTGYDRLCLGKSAEERKALGGTVDTPVVRMLVPDDAPLTFVDVVRGEVSAPRPDDQVVLKADGFPTYHLAVVVDDHLMGITHVVRGEEWISSTPKHLLLYRWLGFETPAFAHMPLLRNTDKSKISKRKNPAARLSWFVEQGYLPEALLNFLALLGYGPADDSEIFTFDQFSASFDWARVNTVGPVFDLAKLDWLNGHYIRELAPADLAARLTRQCELAGLPADAELVTAATPLVQERIQTLAQGADMLRFLLVDGADFVVDEAAAAKQLGEKGAPVLAAALAALDDVTDWTTDAIEAALRSALVDGLELKPRHAYGPVRVAVTGSTVSPPLFESLELLGRDRSLARLRAAARS